MCGTSVSYAFEQTDPGEMTESENLQRTLLALEGPLVGYDKVLSEAVMAAVGDRPADLGPGTDAKKLNDALAHICYPNRWRGDLPGLTYLFKALHHLVRVRGGTPDAGRSVRHDLQTGKLRAVFILEDGRRIEINPHRWLMSEKLWWSGSEVSEPDALRGFVYILDQCIGAGAPEASVSYVPPFMKLMFEAIEHFEIPHKVPKAETLQTWFEGRIVEGVSVSKNAAKSLATFVRPPVAMVGGQKKISPQD
jgi:hypothetical protein